GLVVQALSWHQQSLGEAPSVPSELKPEVIEKLIDEANQQVAMYRDLGLLGESKAEEDKVKRLSAVLASATGAPAATDLISMAWSQLVEDLKQREDLKGSMLLANKYQKPEIFKDSDGPHKLAEMLLFREFMRRPKRQNSLETQGLVKV